MCKHGFKVGDQVRYQPAHFGEDEYARGIVKAIPDHITDDIVVVYHCAGRWDHYMDYTGAMTQIRDLKKGW